VTEPVADLALRPPTWLRAFVAVFPIAFAAFFLVAVRPDGPVWIGAVAVFVFAPLLAWRQFRLAAIGTADGRLVVRNQWRDRTLDRAAVAEVGVDRRAGSTNRSVTLRLRDGSALRLDVTETPFAGPFRGRLDRQAAAVQAWVDGTPQPYR